VFFKIHQDVDAFLIKFNTMFFESKELILNKKKKKANKNKIA
jgi:hypothetical protein